MLHTEGARREGRIPNQTVTELVTLKRTVSPTGKRFLYYQWDIVVRVKGLEPPRHRRQNLNLVRLPIPPHPHWVFSIKQVWHMRGQKRQDINTFLPYSERYLR